jgi:DNA polymerase III alpha subunit
VDISEETLHYGAVKALNETNSMSVFCHGHPLAPLREDLSAIDVVMAKDLRRIPSGRKVRVSGILVILHTPPTKSGKRVMFITMEDESGLIDLVVFPRIQKIYARLILTSTVITVEGKLQRQGNGLSISIIVQRLLKQWTGTLPELLSRKLEDRQTIS